MSTVQMPEAFEPLKDYFVDAPKPILTKETIQVVLMREALDYAIQSINNIVLRKQLMMVNTDIKHGEKFSSAMGKTDFLPETFNGLLEVGEQTGNLAEVFAAMEQRLRDRYENQVAGLITIIEPVMILFMSLIVGSVVIVMLLSMVSMNDINF